MSSSSSSLPPLSSPPPTGSAVLSSLMKVPTGRGTRLATLGAVLIVLAVVLLQVTRVETACTDRFGYKDRFTYAADEAYRHLALAEQIAWGREKETTEGTADARSRGGVLSASASPGWTLGLAGLLRVCGQTGPRHAVRFASEKPETKTTASAVASRSRITLFLPLLVNLIAAGLLILLVAHRMRLDVTGAWNLFVCLLVVGVFMPIPLLVLTGMEHVLHALVLLSAVAVSIDVVERDRLSIGRTLLAAVLMAMAVSLRYESLAAMGALALWAWMRGRRSRVGLMVAAGLAVVLVVGVYLTWHGHRVLPDAMFVGLLAGPQGEWVTGTWSTLVGRLGERVMDNLRSAMVPSAMLLIASALLWSRREQQNAVVAGERNRVAWLFVFVVIGVAHLVIGQTGGLFRYEAYLVPFGAIALARGLASRPGGQWAWWGPTGVRRLVMTGICIVPMALAAVPVARAAWTVPDLCGDVYRRHRTMASFIRSYFDEAVVAVNDGGVVSFQTHAQLVDLSGVANHDVAGKKVAGQWDRHAVNLFCQAAGVRVALMTDPSSSGSPVIPSSWVKIGGWRLTGEGVRAGASVKVYAVSSDAVRDAEIAFRVFADRLPDGVVMDSAAS